MFKKYEKIYSLDKEESEWILSGECSIQEKIDGANLSIWKEGETLYVASRNQIVGDATIKNGFNGAIEYANSHTGIAEILKNNPSFRLYGEWLVNHTIKYPAEYLKKFYLFDILDEESGEFLHPNKVMALADEYHIEHPQVFATIVNPTMEQIQQYAGKSFLGNITGEGVVVKNHSFTNKFGDKTYGKYVLPEFKERNSIEFAHAEKGDWEMIFIISCITDARINKIILKLENQKGSKLERRDTPTLLESMYHDIFSEELYQFLKENKNCSSLDFVRMKKLSDERTKTLFFKFF